MGYEKNEKQANEEITESIVVSKGYTICDRCSEPFKAKHGELQCSNCWEQITRD